MAAFKFNQNGLDASNVPVTSLGIASPCSSCTNRRSLQVDGKPSCPRVVLLSQQQDAITNQTDFSQLEHMTLSGLEANPYATPAAGVFANPVYDTGRNSIYIWVARFVDNQGGMNPDGSAAYPPITDPTFPNFQSDHISCMRFPMVPADTLVQYYNRGRIKESETLLISSFEGQQVGADNQQEIFGGMVSKVSTHKAFLVTARPSKDDHPRGT